MIKKITIDKSEVYQTIYTESKKGSYVSYLRGNRCVDEECFFREVSASFQFPWYFGDNWAAFDDCICDLEWLTFRKIYIVIDDFGLMFGGNAAMQNILLKHFSSIEKYWHDEGVVVEILLNN